MPSPAEIERFKLRATFYNNLAVGSLIAGILTPIVSIILDVPTFHNVSGPVTAILVVSLILVAVILHWMGQAHLRRLDE